MSHDPPLASPPETTTVEAYEAILETQRQTACRKAEEAAALPRPADQPYWVPAGDEYDHLPNDLKQAVVQVINPVYEQLVLQAAPGLAQSTGLTIVHLMWLETLEQLELARLGYAFDTLGQLFVKERHDVLERNLRTVMTKLKASRLLADYERMKAAMLREEALRSSPGWGAGGAGAAANPPPPPLAVRKYKRRPDGTLEWADGALKRPDGRMEYGPPNPRFHDADYLPEPMPEPPPDKELPAGCIRLGNGSFRYPDGSVESPDGIMAFYAFPPASGRAAHGDAGDRSAADETAPEPAEGSAA